MLSLPQRLQVEAAKLRAENRTLKSLGATTGSTGSSVSVAAPNEDGATLRGFRAAGKQFTVLSDLWPQPSILRRPYPPHLQELGPWDASRCTGDASWDEGNVAELYELLPARYHELIEHSALFSDEVGIFLSFI